MVILDLNSMMVLSFLVLVAAANSPLLFEQVCSQEAVSLGKSGNSLEVEVGESLGVMLEFIAQVEFVLDLDGGGILEVVLLVGVINMGKLLKSLISYRRIGEIGQKHLR